MAKKAPADKIENPGRKPSWSQDQMEEAIDRYFEVGNFNRVAEEMDVPVSTLFYKVKIDPRYGKDLQKDVPGKEEKGAQPEPASLDQGELDWGQRFGKAATPILIGIAFGAGAKGGSYAVERFFGPEGIKKLLHGDEEEKVEAASGFCLNFIYNLEAFTGLTDPFSKEVKPIHLTKALAYTLDLDFPEKTIDDQLVNNVAKDWRVPGPLDERIDLGKYRTVPASEVSHEWKKKLDRLAQKRDREIRAYLKDEENRWAILTPAGDVLKYSPSIPGTSDEWLDYMG